MHVQVLGLTGVRVDGPVRQIGSHRQRRLLAALAMQAPATVSGARLEHAVWGDDQPANSQSALRTVVTRLRQTLEGAEPGAGQLIVSSPPGYALHLAEELVDANAFADLVAMGRRQLVEHDPETAGTTLARALSLWQGPAYAEFADEDWANAEANRLSRLWIAARHAELESRLARGLHDEAIGDIEGLIAEEPYSDGPRSLLMRAQFASGRQTDAIRTFEVYRALLVDELGLEPSPELCELESRILQNDPELLAGAGRPLRGYRLHERLGTTGRSEVYRATQPGLGRDVAIEVISSDMASDAAFVREFESRSQALARLDHAHVVPVFDCWRDPGGAYLVSRLLTGGSLADAAVIERLGTDALERALAQVRSALDVAHRTGLVHGPVEAGDVLFDEYDNAYLANFRFPSSTATAEEDDRSLEELFRPLVGSSARRLTAPVPPRVGNPYRGLDPFTEVDVDVFFGRGRLVQETLTMLDDERAAFVVGPSGSGKSSLIRAGVLPALAAGELVGSERWFSIRMTPGASPFHSFQAALLRVASHPPADLLERLRDPDQPLERTVRQTLPEADGELVVLIDQFEELFTLSDPGERDRFLSALAESFRRRDGHLRLLATLRADHFDEPLAHPAIAAIAKRTTVAVDALTGDELRAAIVEPARVAGVTVEADLVGRLIGDATGHPGGLPLLQFVLTRLYETRAGDSLTLEAYEQLGGLTVAIGARAEELFLALGPEGRSACRRIFGRLVTVADAGPDSRRRATRSELRAAESDPDLVDAVVEPFVRARLLGTDRDAETREPTVEVAHEALFREWPRLVGWLEDDRQTIAAVRHLAGAARSWAATGEPGELYRGARLATAVELAALRPERLTAEEREFVDASQDAASAQETARRRQARRLRVLVAGLTVMVGLAVVATTLAVVQRDRARDTQASEEQSRLVALAEKEADRDQRLAMLLAVEAYRRDPSVASVGALQTALTSRRNFLGYLEVDGLARRAAIGNDGSIIIGTLDGLEVFDPGTHERTLAIASPGNGFVDAAKDRPVAATTDGREVTVWNIATGERVRRFTPDSIGGEESLFFAPDGELLVAGASGGLAVYGPDGDYLGEIPTDRVVQTVAFSPDGRLVAVASLDPGGFDVWDFASRSRLPRAEPYLAADDADGVQSVAFSPDGSLVAAGFGRGDVVLWDTTSVPWRLARFAGSGEPIVLDDPEGSAFAVYFADSDPLVVGATGSGRLSTWDLSERTPLGEPRDPATPIRSEEVWPSMDLAHDARRGLVVSVSEYVELWSTDDRELLATPLGPPAGGYVSPSSSGDFVITQEARPSLAAGIVTRRRIGPDGLAGAPEPLDEKAPWGVALSPDDRFVVTGGSGCGGACSQLRLWDAATSQLVGDPVEVPPGLQRRAFSPDGRRLAVGYGAGLGRPISASPLPVHEDTDGIVDILDVTPDGLRLATRISGFGPMLGEYSSLWDVIFSADGTSVMVIDDWPPELAVVAEFSAEDGELLRGPEEIHEKIPGSPRGATNDGSRYLWRPSQSTLALVDRDSLEVDGPPFRGAVNGNYNFARFSADDSLLFAGVREGVAMWDVATRTRIGRPFPNGIFIPDLLPESSPLGFALITTSRSRLLAWNLDVDTWPEIACRAAGRNLTRDEWERVGPDEDYRATCDRWSLDAASPSAEG